MVFKGLIGAACLSVAASTLATSLPTPHQLFGDYSIQQQYGTQSAALLNSPVGIVEGSNGNYFVADTGNGIIRKYNAAGEQIAILGSEGNGHGQLNAPMDISLKDGLLYIPELGAERVTVMDEDGNLVRIIGEGDLEGPRGVWIEDNGDVTVLDEFGHRLVKYTAEGVRISECSDGLSTNGYVDDIIKVDGNYLITEATLGYVVEVGNDCGLVAVHGSYGAGAGQYNLPRGINTDGEFIYVTDTGNNRVQKFDLDMQYIESIGTGYGQLLGPNQIIKHSNGSYIVTSTGDHQIKYFDPTAPANATQVVGDTRSAEGVLANPSGTDVDSFKQELYVANAFNHRIDIFDLNTGDFKRSFGQLGFGAVGGDMLAPQDVLVLSDKILVTNRFLNKVSVFDKNGVETGSFGSAGTELGQFNQPYGIAKDLTGGIYVVDFGNNRLQKFDADFNPVWTTAGFGFGPGQMWAPIRAVASYDGRVFVSDAYNNRIQVLDAATGEYLTSFGEFGEEPGQLSLPFGVALDPFNQVILVSEVANNRISVFKLSDFSFVKTVGQLGSREEDLFFPYEITYCQWLNQYCVSSAVINDVKRIRIYNY